MNPRHYLYDFVDDFKGGACVEVQILYWYTSEGIPRAVVEVIEQSPPHMFPQDGEIHRITVGRKLTSLSCAQYVRESDHPERWCWHGDE